MIARGARASTAWHTEARVAIEASGAFLARNFTRERSAVLADGLAAAIAVALPWSTTVCVALTWLYLIALVPNLEAAELRRAFAAPISALPAALFALAALGMFWADVPIGDRLEGLSGFRLVLFIPGLLLRFRYSPNAHWVLAGFLVSATALLVLSWLLFAFPGIPWHRPGVVLDVPVRDRITQSGEFTVAIFALGALAAAAWRARRPWYAALLIALALGFLANIVYVVTSRTALVALPVLLVLFGLRQFGKKGLLALLVASAALGVLAWASSPYLRARVGSAIEEAQRYVGENADTSVGERLEFWKKSVAFIAAAPVIGRGTGSIHDMFRRAASGEAGPASIASANPHNQIFAVAIQLGAVGVALLLAMWSVHLALFWRPGLAAWIGLVVVVQNVVSSLFNSHLFDFTQGLGYACGVGVAGAAVLRQESARA
jgi:O-antigen ligase